MLRTVAPVLRLVSLISSMADRCAMPQAGAFHVLPAFDTKSTGLAYAVAAGALIAACFALLVTGRGREMTLASGLRRFEVSDGFWPAGDKARAVAAYEGKFIVRFGAKNSRFPQVPPQLVSTQCCLT